jgi:hypothetical protein
MPTPPANLPTLARQGDERAIAHLINRSLQPKGITARVVHHNGHLRVLLESQAVPSQSVLAPYIYQGIVALQIFGLKTIGVVARQPGAATPAWSQTFTLDADANQVSPSAQPTLVTANSTPAAAVIATAATVAAPSAPSFDSPDEASTGSRVDLAEVEAERIARQLNQSLATPDLSLTVEVGDRSLKVTAKTDQLLEADVFAKTLQEALSDLNLEGVETVQIYKQKLRGTMAYQLKEFPLQPTRPELAVDSEVSTAAENAVSFASSPSPNGQSPRPIQPPPKAATAQSKSKLPGFVVIAIAALAVVLLIGAIRFLAKAPSAADVCQDTPGKPEYCQLATQIVGEQTLVDLNSTATPITPQLAEKGIEICSQFTDAQIERNKAQRLAKRTLAVEQEFVSAGIMVIDTRLGDASQMAQQTPLQGQQAKTLGTTKFRTACLFRAKGERIELIKNVVLPNVWPHQPYEGNPEWEPMQRSLKAHQVLVALGGNMVFTAIGLFAASALNLGIQIYSMKGLFKTASILGTMDTILWVVLKGNLFGSIPLTCLALGLSQIWIKDLRVDWAAGYRVVAFGVFLTVFTRIVLNWLLLGFILSVM